MTPNSLIINPDQVSMRKNSCLTNHPIIFVFSENEFEKIDNHFSDLNFLTESNQERDEAVFQVRLKEQKTKERSMKDYSTHWIGNFGLLA